MTSAAAIIRRITRAACAGRGLRFTPEEADLLRAVLELSEADAQARALDQDAGLLDEPTQHPNQDSQKPADATRSPPHKGA